MFDLPVTWTVLNKKFRLGSIILYKQSHFSCILIRPNMDTSLYYFCDSTNSELQEVNPENVDNNYCVTLHFPPSEVERPHSRGSRERRGQGGFDSCFSRIEGGRLVYMYHKNP
uniref:Uncharacterized protein n=1 Tax=Romanomermis culicivorax TaxID=13658 RepID=A0A915KR59_ROMCU